MSASNKVHVDAAQDQLEESRVLDVSDDGEESLESTSAKFIVFRALGVLVFYYLVILIVFGYFDGWATDTNSRSWVKAVDAIYFASTTLSTVGYGDILPTRDETRMVTTLVLLLAFTFILREFNLLTEMWMEKMQERNQKMMSRMAASMDEDGDGVVDEEEMAASLGPLGHCLAMIPPRLVSAMYAVLGLAVNVAVGTFVLMHWEDVDMVTGIYTSLVTMTTVGYGDFSFSHPGTRIFASVWLIVAPVATAQCLNSLLTAIYDTEGRLNRKRQKLLEAPVSVATFKAMDANGDGTMSETEFVVARLITMKMLGSEALPMVQRLKETFQKIDTDQSGHVQFEEILQAQQQQREAQRLRRTTTEGRTSSSSPQWSAAD